MHIPQDIAAYIIAAISIFSGIKALLVRQIRFGGGAESPGFMLEGGPALIAGSAAIVAGIATLFNLILGLILLVITSAIAMILRK